MRIRGLRRFTSFIWQGESGSKGYKIRSGVEKIPLLIFVKNKQNQNDFIKTYVDK